MAQGEIVASFERALKQLEENASIEIDNAVLRRL